MGSRQRSGSSLTSTLSLSRRFASGQIGCRRKGFASWQKHQTRYATDSTTGADMVDNGHARPKIHLLRSGRRLLESDAFFQQGLSGCVC